MNPDEINRDLGQQLLDAYRHGLFGKVSRPEIDAMVFAASVQILYADRQDLWIELEGSRRFNWLRLGVKEFVQIDARLKLSTTRINTLIENASVLNHGVEPSMPVLLAELKLLLNQTKQSSAELKRGLIRLHVVNRTTRKALEAFLLAKVAWSIPASIATLLSCGWLILWKYWLPTSPISTASRSSCWMRLWSNCQRISIRQSPMCATPPLTVVCANI